MFVAWTVDLLIDGPVDNCMACRGANRECGEIAGHLNRTFVGPTTKETSPHSRLAVVMLDVTIMFGVIEMQKHVKTIAYVAT